MLGHRSKMAPFFHRYPLMIMLSASGLTSGTLRATLCSATYDALADLSSAKSQPTMISPTSRKPAHDASRILAVHSQTVMTGPAADIPMVARVSITDYRGNVVLDTFVKPSLPVADYRSLVTGLDSHYLEKAPDFTTVQRQVATLLHGRIIVGYSLWNFLSVIGVPHPAADTRDVALFLPFRQSLGSRGALPLEVLVNRLMGRNIGHNYEHPLENARASLDLFRSSEHIWESAIVSGSWPCYLPPFAYANCFT
ncbi:hypothetical protein DENSPDRAFT_814893 [Dentipellis sp. KUC8613]|nr:hypothetical protein DENSPDRAFT_814893 [Dentipellis sp. KUC8613]